MTRRGLCLVIAAPPGAGKTSVSRALLESEADLTLSVSVTTRAMRPGEQDGVHYHFRDMAEYQAMIARGDLLEHAMFLGRGYGTPRAPVEAALAEGRDVLFDIEWQGHRQLKASMPADVTSIFLLPPSMAELENRLRKRGQDSDAEIIKRMAAAREEITHWDEFDHLLINQDFDATVAAARAILHAARSTRARQLGMADFIKGLLGA
ncbi:MAG: guanylate kinase [Roseomonas sp.]|nr:guanylate kinase [Roseomonas sp.]